MTEADRQFGNSADENATILLHRVRDGDSSAAAALLPLVYEQLRAVSGSYFRGQRADHTLQPTAVVHEAYVKLIGSDEKWESKAHFCAVAAKAMRQVLISHARARSAVKRSGDKVDLTLSDLPADVGTSIDPLALEDVLCKLTELNPEHARLVELRFFGGLSVEEVAHVMATSPSSIKRQWRQVRAWLSCELGGV
jgi:RNA polymerase sigma factor (TIGR02999 family)